MKNRRAAPDHLDHLVIGGGPAGCAVALRLAASGRRVLLVEREREAHHKVCGEFLSREAVHYLDQFGIAPLSLGAQTIHTLRLSSGRRVAAASLPFQALSLSRRVLDEALLVRAQEKCDVVRGVAVESLVSNGDTWIAGLSNGKSLYASAVFLASGKHDLRGFARPRGRQSDLVGFKMHWGLARARISALRGCMDLFLFPGGYGGLSLVENETANLCLVVRRSVLRSLGGWNPLFAAVLDSNEQLRDLLNDAQPFWPRPLAISPIPYGHLCDEDDDLWRIGDQAAVIPSFTGDGISIALHSASLAAEMFLAGHNPANFYRTLRAQLGRSMSLATWLSRAAVTAPGRAVAFAAASLIPSLMPSVATFTRIPERSLLRSVSLPAAATHVSTASG
jgi:menaquinone-9 beta-reductase